MLSFEFHTDPCACTHMREGEREMGERQRVEETKKGLQPIQTF